MYWSAKLKRALRLESEPELPKTFSGDGAEVQILSVLSKNPAINDDASVASALLKDGEVVYFRRGEEIIRQGATDKDVYFLLAGSVDIVFKSQLGSKREAPNQIGEMAAITPGSTRSASVIANSDEVAALKVSGVFFYDLWSKNAGFEQLLQVEMTARHRERIAASEVARQNNSLSWFITSVGAGLSVALVSWLISLLLEWTSAAQAAFALTLGVLAFLLMLLHNPAFFWRRCCGIIVLALVASTALDHFLLVDASEGFGGLQVSFGTNNIETSAADKLTSSFGMLGALAICAVMDFLTRRG